MLKALVALALTRRPIVILLLVVLVGGGLAAFSKLNIEAYPNPAPVILEITAQAPGLSAEEMERYYTIPMEIGLATTPGVDVIRSTSFYGLSFVRVVFNYGVDYNTAYTQAAINLQQRVNLPNNVQPTIQGSSLVGEIFRYQVVGPPHFGLTNLRTVQDWVLQRRFLTVPGVIQVVTWGGTTKSYDAEIDLHKLDAYNITLQQVLTALGNANENVGGRTINVGQQSVNVRGLGLIQKVEDIENVVLTSQPGGIPVLVKDVASVSVGYLPRLGKAGRDDEDDVVTGIVIMHRSQKTNEVLARVEAEIEKINSDGSLPPGVRAVPYYDRGALTSVTTRTVLHNLLFGCLLVFLIQWIFLGDLRSAIIVGANVPFALFFTVIILVSLGDSANLLSVGAVDIGIIVDACVILIENVFRNYQLSGDRRREFLKLQLGSSEALGWSERLQMIFASAVQVNKAVFYSTAITVAAFVPLFTMQGVEGQIFNPMARTYAYALAGALLATFTITPVLASYLLPEHVRETETVMVRTVHSVYERILRWTLSHRSVVVGLGVLFLTVTGSLALRLGTEFLPHLEEGNLWIRAALPPTISLEAGEPFTERMRKILRGHPEVITVVSQHGRPDDGSDAAGFFNVELFAPLKPFDEWTRGLTKDKLIEQIQKEFADEFTGITFNFSQYIQDNIEEQLSGVKGSNSVKVIGTDLAILERIATEVLAVADEVKGVSDLGIFRVLGQPNLNITVDRAKAARYGLNTGDINSVIQAALAGTEATVILEGERRFSLIVRLAPEYRDRLDAVRNLKVGYQSASGANGYVPLRELATISLDTGASYIYRESNQRYVPIKFSVRGRDLGSTVADAQAQVARKVKLPEGFRIDWAGEFGSLQKAKARLAIIVPVSLLFIVILLYGLFNSFHDSLLALSGIPFAIAGGLLALYVAGLDFSISAAIGFISVFGISVMNGILLIGYYNEVRESGMHTVEAMFHAASQRMRSVLMTGLSACIGLLPAAISTGIGSQVQRPLATVVVGGLLIGPIMLLVVVPALCVVFLSKRDRADMEAGGGE
ncbi:MAG TPA: CusA/CzcA family heavy metal efflux RND transporter [Burkholderiales bacterium]|nr:CusA/CzcA family heavy metal efflux RND transporter [Burkholderiales bacterium]